MESAPRGETLTRTERLLLRPFTDVRHDASWAAWRALAHDAPPFLAPEFFDLTRRLGLGEPLVAEAWASGALRGVLPVVRVGRDLHALRSDQTPGFDYVGDVDALGALFRALETDPGWDVLRLKNVPEGSPLATRLPEVVRAAGGRAVVRPGARHYVFELASFETSLAPKFLANLRRCERKLGGVSFERLTHPTRADFVEAFGIEAMAWKAAAGTAMAIDARVSHLYEIVIRLFGAAGHASLSFIRADGRRVATLFAVEDGHTFFALKIGYDPQYAAASPGHVMVLEAARDAAARGLARFDFVGREDAWKKKWTERHVDQVTVTLYRPTPRALARFAVDEVMRPRLAGLKRLRTPFASGCQRIDHVGFHGIGERIQDRVGRGFGIRSGVRRVVHDLRAGHEAKPQAALGAPSRFAPGTWVRVRSEAEVRATLGPDERTRGLKFVPTQWQACGGVYKVVRHVRRMRDDGGHFRAIHRTVLLEGVTCAGKGPAPAGCGRHCPLMFRDEWLEEATAEVQVPPAAFVGLHAHVRSVEEIRATLDLFGRHDGLSFMSEMEAYAGQRFRVVGQLPQVFECDHWVEPRAPIYLLEGLACKGDAVGKNGPCDRACALLWHRDWLSLEPAPEVDRSG